MLQFSAFIGLACLVLSSSSTPAEERATGVCSVDLSCQKARSSALFSAPSAAFEAFPGIELSNGIISNLRGGLPLWASAGVSAGSIGVSGGQTGEEDEQLAMVAVANVNNII